MLMIINKLILNLLFNNCYIFILDPGTRGIKNPSR